MKTSKFVKNRKNHKVFIYNNEEYDYADIYNLVKKLKYRKSGIDCDWTLIKVHDIKDDTDCYALVFRQTTTNKDWRQNLKFFPKFKKAYKGWKNKLVYHCGFYEEYQSARDDIKKALSPVLQDLSNENKCSVSDLKLYVFGWSLGASIAPIACEDIHETYGIKPILIAYEGANPCETNHTRKVIMNSINKEESISFVYGNDIVCRCPPIFGKPLKDTIYYLDDKKCKFPFYFIKKIISFIKDTEYYHTSTDKGILSYMPNEE